MTTNIANFTPLIFIPEDERDQEVSNLMSEGALILGTDLLLASAPARRIFGPSIRINIPKINNSGRRLKRLYKFLENFSIRHMPSADIDRSEHIDLCAEWYAQRCRISHSFRMNAENDTSTFVAKQRIRQLASASGKGTLCTEFRNKNSNALEAAIISMPFPRGRSAYAHSFYYTESLSPLSPGKSMIHGMIDFFKASGIEHLYLGSWDIDPRGAMHYKTQIAPEATELYTLRCWHDHRVKSTLLKGLHPHGS